MSTQPVQLSLAYMDIKTDAKLSDFDAPSFTPILCAVHELIDGKIPELYLIGNTGSGKSHLLSAIHKAYLKTGRSAIFVSLQEIISTDTQALTGLEMFNLILIDDLHLAAQHLDWQEALFHLINRARRQHCQLIYSATAPTNELGFSILDLTTRLSQALTFVLPSGDNDRDRRALLSAILRQKGWQLPDSISDYLVEAGPHHVGDMLKVVSAIVPYVNYRGRKLPQKLLDEIKAIIRQESLLVELADIELDQPFESDDNHTLTLPMTHYL